MPEEPGSGSRRSRPTTLPSSLPSTFAATRDAWHKVAEYVLAPARYRATGHIGLIVTPGGFATPPFDDDTRVRVDGTDLVVEHGNDERRAPLTTLGAAAEFAGVDLGVPTGVYTPATSAEPDAPLAVDANAAAVLAEWMELCWDVLGALRAESSARAPSALQLWPEHFDMSVDFGDEAAGLRANYGASPGDAAIASPYLYVGAWDATRRSGLLGGYDFGAALAYDALATAADPAGVAQDFFADRASLLDG